MTAAAEIETGAFSDNIVGLKFLSTLAYLRVNTAILDTVSSPDSRGFFIANRLNSNDNDLFRNKTKILDASTASFAITSATWRILGWNNGGALANPTTKQISLQYTGAGLSQSEVDTFTDAFETYMDYNGKGIIT